MERTRPPPQLSAEETHQVLRRAAELDRREDDQPTEPSLDLAEVERIGVEAGLSREAIQRAFVELRAGGLRVPHKPGVVDSVLGPPSVEAQRLLPTPPAAARRDVDATLKAELLHPEERNGSRTTWSPAPGLWAGIQRTLNWQGQGQWQRGTVVSEVTPAPPGIEAESMVRLEARPAGRIGYLIGGLAPGLSMLPASVASAFVPHAPPAMPIVFGAVSLGTAAVGLLVSRFAYRRRLRSLRQAVERVLDKLGTQPELG
jgi:hypothetical protein